MENLVKHQIYCLPNLIFNREMRPSHLTYCNTISGLKVIKSDIYGIKMNFSRRFYSHRRYLMHPSYRMWAEHYLHLKADRIAYLVRHRKSIEIR